VIADAFAGAGQGRRWKTPSVDNHVADKGSRLQAATTKAGTDAVAVNLGDRRVGRAHLALVKTRRFRAADRVARPFRHGKEGMSTRRTCRSAGLRDEKQLGDGPWAGQCRRPARRWSRAKGFFTSIGPTERGKIGTPGLLVRGEQDDQSAGGACGLRVRVSRTNGDGAWYAALAGENAAVRVLGLGVSL